MTDDLKQRGAQVERLLSALPLLLENELWQFLTSELENGAKALSRDVSLNASYIVGYRAAVDDLLDTPDRLKEQAKSISDALEEEAQAAQVDDNPSFLQRLQRSLSFNHSE